VSAALEAGCRWLAPQIHTPNWPRVCPQLALNSGWNITSYISGHALLSVLTAHTTCRAVNIDASVLPSRPTKS